MAAAPSPQRPESPLRRAEDAIQIASEALRNPPDLHWSRPSRYGTLVDGTRSILARLLRPYLESQRMLEQGMLEALSSLAEALAPSEETVTQLERRLGQMDPELVRLQEDLYEWRDRLGRQLERLHEEIRRSLDAREERFLKAIEELEARVQQGVDNGTLSDELRSFQATVGRRLDDLSESVQQSHEEAARLARELRVIPYIAEPNLLRTSDPSGRETIGYQDSPGDPSLPR